MEFTNRNSNISNITYTPIGEQTRTRSFLANVFLLMFIALGVSALFAWQFSINANLLSYLITPDGHYRAGKNNHVCTTWLCANHVFWLIRGFRRLHLWHCLLLMRSSMVLALALFYWHSHRVRYWVVSFQLLPCLV